MDIYDIIRLIVYPFGVIIGIRQFKGTWGWMLLVLGLTDIITFAGYFYFHLPVHFFHVASFTIQVFALYYVFFEKHKMVIIPISLLLIIPGIYLSNVQIDSIILLLILYVFLFFIRKFALDLFNHKKTNLFYIIFSTYSLITILKIITIRTRLWEGVDLFYMANIFQIIMMIPFLFIRHDDERLSISLKK